MCLYIIEWPFYIMCFYFEIITFTFGLPDLVFSMYFFKRKNKKGISKKQNLTMMWIQFPCFSFENKKNPCHFRFCCKHSHSSNSDKGITKNHKQTNYDTKNIVVLFLNNKIIQDYLMIPRQSLFEMIVIILSMKKTKEKDYLKIGIFYLKLSVLCLTSYHMLFFRFSLISVSHSES